MWSKAKQARMDEIHDELGLMLRTKNFSSGEMDKLVTEGERLVTERDNYEKAKGMGCFASPSEYGMAGTNPGDDNGFAFKGFGPGMEHQIRADVDVRDGQVADRRVAAGRPPRDRLPGAARQQGH